MLELSMDLEGDLGIDSIKRVEILAAVQEQAPGMPDVDTNKMGSLRTLGQIVDYMQGLMPGANSVSAPVAQAAAPSTASVSKAVPANLGRFTLKMVEREPAGLAQAHLFGTKVYVTKDQLGVAEHLVSGLKTLGVDALVTESVPANAKSAVFLGGINPIETAEEGVQIEKSAFEAAKALAPNVKDGGLFVTVQDTGGAFGTTDFDPVRAYVGGLPGLVKTAAQEWTEASLKAIDIQTQGLSPEAIALALVTELVRGGADIEVGLLGPKRMVPQSVAANVPAGSVRINAGDVVVVSGGARGVTASCVIEWASRSKASFVLLGRTPLQDEPAAYASASTDADLKRVLLAEAKASGEAITPAQLSRKVSRVLANREVNETIAAIEETGGKAKYVAADVQDADALNTALAQVRNEWGPIKAVVHGAGVLADKYIADMSQDDFDFVFNTKVGGWRALMSALKTDPVEVICMFSSVAGRCGNAGQANYSMANEVLNKIAQAEQGVNPNMLVKSLGWGPWEGGMVSPELKAHFERMGVPMIPLEVGAKMFADEMQSTTADVELVLGGEPRSEALIGGKERPFKLEVNINHITHGFLRGHSIAGAAVVPVVLVLEWFSRLARAARPDLHLSVIKNLKVLKGIRLQDFEGAGDRFVLTSWPVANGSDLTLQMELHSASGALHYRAMAELSSSPVLMPKNTLATPSLNTWGSARVYGDVLFHTDDFQVIKELEGVSAQGIAGALKGVHEAQWNWDAWQTDVAAFDGGLQMLLLWAREGMGGAVLPMGIGELRMTGQAPSEGEIRCVAQCKASSSSSAVADLVFTDAKGATFAEMKHVELVKRPDVKS
jgi:NAD(P)-dependent dehydrogenase (short-subunit alcohol dehydrogenase family)/acyl carrier protein